MSGHTSVTLTNVRIQGYGRHRLGLWILTFVRMTTRGKTRYPSEGWGLP